MMDIDYEKIENAVMKRFEERITAKNDPNSVGVQGSIAIATAAVQVISMYIEELEKINYFGERQ